VGRWEGGNIEVVVAAMVVAVGGGGALGRQLPDRVGILSAAPGAGLAGGAAALAMPQG
jgi:hypothetical protein